MNIDRDLVHQDLEQVGWTTAVDYAHFHPPLVIPGHCLTQDPAGCPDPAEESR